MANEVVVREKDIAESVLVRVKNLESQGGLRLPKDYSAENALKSAWLILQETSNKDGKYALQHCTKASIANSLLDMVVQGLNPVKKQCYFIMYGQKLQMSRSYMGTVAVSKRYGGIVETRANVIYKDDEFEFEIDSLTGDRKILKHKQTLDSLNGEITGAYAILTLDDGRKYTEIMPIQQIKNAWNRGQSKGNSMAHKDHPEEMCKKTVISRACKLFINTSDDSALFDADDEFDGRDYARQEIAIEANQGDTISFDEPIVIEAKEEASANAESQRTITPDGEIIDTTVDLDAGF